MSRAKRKQDHIQFALSTGQERTTGFDEVAFVHHSLPNIAVNDVSLETKIGELLIGSPIFINAMTGGGGEATVQINQSLASIAKELRIPIAVGSQMSAIKDPSEKESYEIVRKTNKDGIVFANLGSEATVEQARQAVEMIEANSLQIHLNVIQELTMPEGDRDFKGAIDRIQHIASSLSVPVIVKETGFGISAEAAEELAKTDIFAIDVSGFGGTNFAKIENSRRARMLNYFDGWGIPTATSIVEVKSRAKNKKILASGGIQNSLDIAKAISLGADAVGMAGYVLKMLTEHGLEKTLEEIKMILDDLTFIMCALGCKSTEDLRQAPLILSGDVYHWLHVRGLRPEKFSMRN